MNNTSYKIHYLCHHYLNIDWQHKNALDWSAPMKKLSSLFCLTALLCSLTSFVSANDDFGTGFYAVDPNGGVTYLGDDQVPEDYVLPNDGKLQPAKIPADGQRYISKEEAEFRATLNLVPNPDNKIPNE